MTVVDDPTQFFSAAALQDPYPLYDRMRAEAPVHRIGDSVFYAVCGWSAVQEAVERVDDFSSNLTATMVFPDDDVDKLIRLGYAATTLLDGIVTPDQLQAAGMAAMELSGYVMGHFENASASAEHGLIADMAERYASGELEQTPAMGIMITLFSAAGESTASLLGSAAGILADHPEIQRQVRENPELLGVFIEETLRFESPFRGHYRHVWRDTTLGGVQVPADSHLLLLWGAANRDPEHFEAPNEFRLDRSSAKDHLTFGKGVHFCVGAALARLEARIVLGKLLERTSWIDAVDVGEWLPSILVRRRERLHLAVR